MKTGKSLLQKSYLWFVISIILLTALFLFWIVRNRIEEYKDYHHYIAFESITGVSNEVARFVEEHNHRVKLFARFQLDVIRAVVADPRNELAYQTLKKQIEEYFPNHFAFTVTSPDGVPLFEDFDGFVAESCQVDIKQFANEHIYHPYVHPNHNGYHFDVMSLFGDNEGVLFVSFHVDLLGTILRSAQSLGHRLMLIYPSRQNLIEVVSAGARIHLERNDYRLSKSEEDRIIVQVPVIGTRWDAVDVIEDGLFRRYENQLIFESVVIFVVLLLVGIVMVMRLRKEEVQRELAEIQKKEMMGVITHELRTPGAAVHGALQILKRNTERTLSDESKSLLALSLNNTQRLLTLIGDFLDLDKYESGKLSFDKADHKLVDIVRKTVEQNQSYAEQFDVNFRVNDTTVDVMVHCDANRIEQVLANFLSNAAKYGGENDVIEVLVNKPSANTVRVSVIDHGEGVAEDIKDKIFDKFIMSNASRNAKVRSSGLGLSIARAIIEKHDGQIDFSSEPGKGSTFYFELPVVKTELV